MATVPEARASIALLATLDAPIVGGQQNPPPLQVPAQSTNVHHQYHVCSTGMHSCHASLKGCHKYHVCIMDVCLTLATCRLAILPPPTELPPQWPTTGADAHKTTDMTPPLRIKAK